MKKNRMMRMASGLLVLTLITTCIISGTFAKYTTEATGNDTARVAKWGVVAQVSGTLFGERYFDVNASGKSNEIALQPQKSADSSDTTNIVAPGTQNKNDGLKFSISGTPEVKTQVTINVKTQDIYLKQGTYAVVTEAAVTEANFDSMKSDLYTESNGVYTNVSSSAYASGMKYYTKINGDVTVKTDYYPVKYSAGDIASDQTAIALAKTIAGKVNNSDLPNKATDRTKQFMSDFTATKTYDANASLNEDIGLVNQRITWSWAFEDSKINNKDDMDTILGYLIAGDTDYAVVVVNGNDMTKISSQTIGGKEGLIATEDGKQTIYGSTKASFDLTIKAEQVD